MPPRLARWNKAPNRFSVGDEDGVGIARQFFWRGGAFEVEEAFEGGVGDFLEQFENVWPYEFSNFMCGPRKACVS